MDMCNYGRSRSALFCRYILQNQQLLLSGYVLRSVGFACMCVQARKVYAHECARSYRFQIDCIPPKESLTQYQEWDGLEP
jgi:hypothetical protein